VDHAQNLGIPHFSGEQPGDTYYYFPLSVYYFGIVDALCTPKVLHCYLCQGQLFRAEQEWPCLTFRFVAGGVGLHPICGILFFVCGHTKNVCDRIFNLLKSNTIQVRYIASNHFLLC
jgi:hypothetical protein